MGTFKSEEEHAHGFRVHADLKGSCNFCTSPPVYFARYSGRHYCRKHFLASVETRVRREMRRQRILDAGCIAVAVSGGKDSMTALHLLSAEARGRRGVDIIALTVDEGITGYRDSCLKLIAEYCRKKGIEWLHSSYADYVGFTMDALAPLERKRTSCAYCGVVRRSALNSLAKSAGAQILVTGHNLDDGAQSMLMNLVRGDADRMRMMAPHPEVIEGLVPRATPLRLLPENEVLLYATLMHIPFIRSSCPYSEEASRNLFRDILYRLEEAMPGSRHAIVGAAEKLGAREHGVRIGRCSRCGEPCSGKICRTCGVREEVRELLSS